MTTPISQDVGIFSSGHTFPSFDEKICRIICEGIKEDFQSCLEKGLCPDYCLKKSIFLENLVFPKGAPLIFVIVHCCKKTSFQWDLIEMVRLLLEKNINLEILFDCEEGGGKLNILEYACENEHNLSSEMLLMLFGAADPSMALPALNKLSDPEKRKKVQQQLSVTPTSLLIPRKTFFSVNENQLCRDLLEGNTLNLRNLFEKGLNPNYVLTTSPDINGFLCRKNESLLMIVLRACAATKCSMKTVESLALLIENNVNLEQSCLGLYPLRFVCENEPLFSKHVITCLLTSVSPKTAFSALEHVKNSQHKNMLKNILKTCPFIKDEKSMSSDNCELSSTKTETLHVETVKIPSSDSQEIRKFPEITHKQKYCYESSTKPIVIENLLLKIENDDYSELTNIVSTPKLLQRYEDYVTSSFQQTFIYFLFSKVENKERLYKVCRCFFTYGFSPETVVVESIKFWEFACGLRSSFFQQESLSTTYFQILCLTLFHKIKPVSIKQIEKKISWTKDRKFLEIFFYDDPKTSSIKLVGIEDMLGNYKCFPVILAFLDASLIQNKNVITQEPWNIETYFTILTSLMRSLCNTKVFSSSKVIQIKNLLFTTFESVLELGMHPNNFKEDNKFLFVSWLQNKAWSFMNLESQKKTIELLQQKWNLFLLPKTLTSAMTYTPRIFDIPLRMYFLSYGEVLENFLEKTIKSKISFSNVSVIQECLEIFLSELNPITKKSWNFQDLCCLLSSVFVELSLILPLKKTSLYQHTVIFMLQHLPEALFIASIKPEFSIDNKTNAYAFMEKTINNCNVKSEIIEDWLNLLKKYWAINSETIQEPIRTCSPNTLFNENRLCLHLLEGDELNLRCLFAKGLNPNYVLTTFVDVNGFSCRRGDSLLMIVLRAYVATKCSMKVVNSLSLLIEHNVSLEQTCLGIQPLHYVCENENLFSSEVVTCLLNSVSKQAALTAVEYISDPTRRAMFKDILDLKIFPFKFLEDKESDYSYACESHIKISKESATLEVSNKEASETISLEKLLSQLENNDLSELETIVSNPLILQKYDNYITTLASRQTLIHFLFYAVKNKEILYKVCRCFFKHGFSPETAVRDSTSFFDFIFAIRNKIESKKLTGATYLQILCLTLFFNKRPISINNIAMKSHSVKEQKLLKSFFKDDPTTSSVKPVCIENVVGNYQFVPLILAFLDASLIQNKNVVTQEPWNKETYFTILTLLMKYFCKTRSFGQIAVIRVKNILLKAFESVLELGIHPNNFKEENKLMFVSWLQNKAWKFFNSTVEVQIWKLLQKRWSAILCPRLLPQEELSQSMLFKSPLRKYFLSYYDILENFVVTIIKSNTDLCLASLQSQLELLISTGLHPITKKNWNFQDFCCLLSSCVIELSEIMNSMEKFTAYEEKVLFILKNLPEAIFLTSIKIKCLVSDITDAYSFLEKEIKRSVLNTEMKTQFINLLNKYWYKETLQTSKTIVTRKRKREET